MFFVCVVFSRESCFVRLLKHKNAHYMVKKKKGLFIRFIYMCVIGCGGGGLMK